jgi:tetratricopeptide (TPR) repeat protein
VAKVVSVQGSVQVRRAGEAEWIPVKLDDIYCPGDMVRVQEQSRAAIILPNETLLRLDQKTTITFNGIEKERTSLLDLIKGAIHFFSRTPRALKVATPFVNGTVEGTEFFVRVEPDHTFISIFEGRVAATNALGSLILTSGQSAVAEAGKAPVLRVVVRPRDAVRWALYYPPIVEYRPEDFPEGTETDWQGMVRRSIQFYWEGDLVRAFSSLAGAPEGIRDPRFFTYRAALLLSVGRVDKAEVDIQKALKLDASNSHAFALHAIIAMVQNRKDESLELAEKAVGLDPRSSVARVAFSYAQQAHFDLEGALKSLEEAVKLDPENALALARLAELWLSVGYLDKALEVAQKAVALNPKLARTQTVLGFAYLTQIKTKESKNAFEKAIRLDQAASLPRLGLGLAKIRDGDLKEGRQEIEIAASLDPNNSLIRSYLGKAYFEEKRTELDGKQYEIAKELDPLDPTPWFYDAIRKQTVNRPVEALHDLQKSIELNDYRAVYRSRLLLDDDLAARSASLGRIYRDLDFLQLALVEGWKSANTDQDNYSAHRLLADTYSVLPRHQNARVSELLQSQLFQPINITPVQPTLAETNLFILEGAGPADPAFNEFNPLFLRNRLALQGSGVAGENDTRGGEVVQSGVWGRASYSIGGLRYKTDGFRVNNDLEQDIYNVFLQGQISHKTSVQAEYRYSDHERGDLELTFTGSVIPTLRQKEQVDSIRLGFRHAFTPSSVIIASLMYQDADLDTVVFPGSFELFSQFDNYIGEARYLYNSERFQITGGIGRRVRDGTLVTNLGFGPSRTEPVTRYTNAYLYSYIDVLKDLNLTLGASADLFNGAFEGDDRDQFNPKFGLTWDPFPSTTIRAAVFRTLQRPFISRINMDGTLEPTQVAGFNQFFFGAEGDRVWRYGVAVDQKLSRNIYGGVEFSVRDLDRAITVQTGPSLLGVVLRDWEERLGRAYLYLAPSRWLALSAEYLYEWFERDVSGGFTGVEEFAELRTHRFPLGIRFFHPSGFSAGIKATYVDQRGDFAVIDPTLFTFVEVPGDDDFWVVDASVGYRLPKRYGLITVEANNLFDETFRFQDTDPANPRIMPERLILAKFTLSF